MTMKKRYPWPSAYRKFVRLPDIQHQFPLAGVIWCKIAAVDALAGSPITEGPELENIFVFWSNNKTLWNDALHT
jgi:hypothetical protein